jgi:WD40 repeat protein
MVAAYGTTHYAANSLRQGSSARMVLWDLSTNQQVAAMPVMPDSDAQDKAVTAFTPDGKYLIYGDGKAGTGKGRVLRVYDIAAKRNIAEIPGKSVAGRGPTPASVYVRTSSGEPAIVRYDAASNTSTPVALPQRSIKCIGGDKIGYVRSEEGRGFFCIADLVSTP